MFLLAGLESYVAVRFRRDSGNTVDAPTPWYIWVPWFLAVTSCVSYYLYLMTKKDATTETTGNEFYLADTPEGETPGWTPED